MKPKPKAKRASKTNNIVVEPVEEPVEEHPSATQKDLKPPTLLEVEPEPEPVEVKPKAKRASKKIIL